MLQKSLSFLIIFSFLFASCTNQKENEIAKIRKTHEQYLANSPFNKTQELTKAKRKELGIPPNKYLERQWELTMNPLKGRPTPEKLLALQAKLAKADKEIKGVPGVVNQPWIERGPGNVGGRTKAVMFDPNDATHKRVFAGGVSGGLWVNNDISNPSSEWQLTGLPHNLAVSSISVDPNNSQVFYVGTGESYTSGAVNGNGVWKSTDAGMTWSHVFGGQNGEAQFQTNATLTINIPASLQGNLNAVIASFGDVDFNNFSGNLVLTNDGSADPTLACNPLTNAAAVNGNIAVIERGTCYFVDKIKNAQNAGAIGVLMINNVDGTPIIMGGTDATITIPSVMISKADGAAILAALGNNETISINVTNNHLDFAMGYIVPGITHVNDIVCRNNNGTTEIYVTAGDSYFSDASPLTVMGHGYQGLYKSTDNGATWQQVNLPLDPDGHTYTPFDLEIGADNKIWMTTTRSTVFGAANGAIFSSTDGNTFNVVLPVTNIGRMELAVSKTDPGKMYLLAVQYSGNSSLPVILKTTDGFASNFSQPANPSDGDLGGNDFTNGQAFYDLVIELDPTNDDTVYVGGIDLFKSTNGGSSWTQISSAYGNTSSNDIHPDQQGIAILDANHILFGNDGGVAYSADGGTTIEHRNNKYNVTQFYHMAVGPTTAFNGDYFMAGAQDNGTQLFENAPQSVANSTTTQGGDGAYCFFDQDGTDKYRISNYVYNNNIRLYDYSIQYWKTVNLESTSHGDFINQEALDSHLNILYANYSTRSSSGNTYVIRRYKDLTGTISKYNISNPMMNSFPTALKVSPYTTNNTSLFVGLQNGKLLKILRANTARNFFDITGSEFVGSISDIEFGDSEDEIFVTMFNYGVNNIFYTNDGGATWVKKEGDLPDMPVNTIMRNPLNHNEVLIGTDLGIWATPNFNDANPNWYRTYNGMRDVKVTDIELRDDNMVFVSTYGRGVFSGQFTADTNTINEEEVLQVNVYPNPATEVLQVQLPDAMNTIAYVYDINGRRVMQQLINHTDKIKFNVSHLSKGTYFVSLKNGKNLYSAKFIVK